MEFLHPLRRLFLLLAVAAVVSTLAASPAAAQDAATLDKVTKLNKKAIDDYQKKNFEAARDRLKEALEMCNSAGLESHPIKARTHIHLGIVLIGGLKQRDAGLRHFQKALQIQADIQLTKSLATPALQDAFEEAMVAGGGGGEEEPKRAAAAATEGDADPALSEAIAGSDDEEEQPKPRRGKKPMTVKRKKAPSDEEEEGGEDEGDKGKGPTVFIGFAAGSGMGLATGEGETTSSHKLGGAGFAPAQLLHLAPEVGYYVNRGFILSLQGRIQFVSGLNAGPTTCGGGPCTTEQSTALAAFVRATWLSGEEDFHLYFSAALGGGYVRHAANFPPPSPPNCGPQSNMTCVDTFAGGPLLLGPGVGFMYDVGSAFSLVVGLNTQIGVPKFTFNIDLNAGFGLRF